MSFKLELEFHGIILIDQHAEGTPHEGLHLFMPAMHHHQTILEYDRSHSSTGASSMSLQGGIDLFEKGGGGAVQVLGDFVRVSEIERKSMSVHPAWFTTGAVPPGLESHLRLPLATSIVPAPSKPKLDLEFTNGGGAKWRRVVAGVGVIRIPFTGSVLRIGKEVLDPKGATMAAKLRHLPPHIEHFYPPCDVLDHHISGIYPLFAEPGKPSPKPPSVYFWDRVSRGPSPMLAATAASMPIGGDPAQCTPTGT